MWLGEGKSAYMYICRVPQNVISNYKFLCKVQAPEVWHRGSVVLHRRVSKCCWCSGGGGHAAAEKVPTDLPSSRWLCCLSLIMQRDAPEQESWIRTRYAWCKGSFPTSSFRLLDNYLRSLFLAQMFSMVIKEPHQILQTAENKFYQCLLLLQASQFEILQ